MNVTQLRFELPCKQRVKITVYDITGRIITTLCDRELRSGRYKISWDGKDREGYSVPNGTYFVKIESKKLVVKKLIKIK